MWGRPRVPSVSGMRIVGLLAPALVLAGVSGCADRSTLTRPTDRHRIVRDRRRWRLAHPASGRRRRVCPCCGGNRCGAGRATAVVEVGGSTSSCGCSLEAVRRQHALHLLRPATSRRSFACYDLEVGVSECDRARAPCPALRGATPVRLPPPPPERRSRSGPTPWCGRCCVTRRPRTRTTTRSPPYDEGSAAHRRVTSPRRCARAVHAPTWGSSVRGDDGCLLGRGWTARVLVWRPSSVQVQPGELSCDPTTALAGWGSIHRTDPHVEPVLTGCRRRGVP